jgi:uncharacterized cupredoxin-like copper-binding protein
MKRSLAVTFGTLFVLAVTLLTGPPARADTSAAATATHVKVTLTEMAVTLGAVSAPTGPIVFEITNKGTIEHEFVILKTDVPFDSLDPSKDEPGKADETGHVDEVDPVNAGTSTSLAVTLDPGKYVLICNKPGHYAAGMRVGFTVYPVGAAHVSVTLTEMALTVNAATSNTGPIVFDIANKGATEHEFVILRTKKAFDALPPSADEVGKASEVGHVDEVDPIGAGTSAALSVTLAPGNYVLLCNKPGHYMAGMRAAFTVKLITDGSVPFYTDPRTGELVQGDDPFLDP